MRASGNVLAGISVGTSKISVIVAEQTASSRYAEGAPEALQVLGVGYSDSRGLSKGVIVNLKEAKQSVMRAVQEARNITNKPIKSAVVAFNSLDVNSETTSGMIALDGRDPRPVTEQDLLRAIEAAQSRLEPSKNNIAIHTIPVRYDLDGRSVDEPLNMTGKRLEILLQTVSVPVTYVQNILTCMQEAGIEVEELILKPLASSLGAVSDEEIRSGCISISIGGGATGVVLYRGGRPFKITSIPIGGQHITSDLASVFKISWHEAERLKKRLFLPEQDLNKDKDFDLDIDPNDAVQVIGDRVEELFTSYVRPALADCPAQMFPNGVVLSGGVSKTPGLADMLSDILQMQVREAKPFYNMPPGCEDTSFVSAAGILRYFSYRNRYSHLFVEPVRGEFNVGQEQEPRIRLTGRDYDEYNRDVFSKSHAADEPEADNTPDEQGEGDGSWLGKIFGSVHDAFSDLF